MPTKDAEIGSMKAEIRSLVSALQEKTAADVERDRKQEERDQASAEWREKMVDATARIETKLETQIVQQAANLKYQQDCDAERKVMLARLNTAENELDDHEKEIDDHELRVKQLELDHADLGGKLKAAMFFSSIIGGALGFILDFVLGAHK